jgi:hypothetical protein
LKREKGHLELHGAERFLNHTEFKALQKAANDDRELRILLLLAGDGLAVGEMTRIRAEAQA